MLMKGMGTCPWFWYNSLLITKMNIVDRPDLIVIGGGLAGSEAAWQAAQRGLKVNLYEMRPNKFTGAHVSPYLAELICSNSLGSDLPDRATGVLISELRRLGSLLIHCADTTKVPGGNALVVDREAFAQKVTSFIEGHQNINLIRCELNSIPSSATIIASGPLTSPGLSQSISVLTGRDHLYFYDAISPIVIQTSINMNKAFRASRYGQGNHGEGDYINCPMARDEYYTFVDALLNAEKIELKEFERNLESGVKAGAGLYFEGCLPIEILAQRGRDALAYGPMRPVGLNDPRIGKRAYAVVQLRQDNLSGSLYNLVGFQTNLKFQEQGRVFRLIPGLEGAEFARYGQMHRNTFIASPILLRSTLQFYDREDLFFAGQITGVEGYVGNIATGLLAGWNATRMISGQQPLVMPETTILGSLCHYVTHARLKDFQPMKANFGILPPLDSDDARLLRGKRVRAQAFAFRAKADMETYLSTTGYDLLSY
jgi:methylenetetrahydrofolate--tRNA-(uracil-5-)-methyltransferase